MHNSIPMLLFVFLALGCEERAPASVPSEPREEVSLVDSVAPSSQPTLQDQMGLPFYPGATVVSDLTSLNEREKTVVLATDDSLVDVVRFYELDLGRVARVTRLTDREEYEFSVDSESARPGRVHIRAVPLHLRGAPFGARNSIVLHRGDAQ